MRVATPTSDLQCIPRGAARGVTLLELMMAVAIVGVLVALAYPTYAEQVRRGQRADAQTVLLEAAQFMQRVYAAKNSFEGAVLPDGYKFAPRDSSATTRRYDVTVSVGADNRSFVLAATPVIADTKCGTLTMTDTGKKGLRSATSTVAECWR